MIQITIYVEPVGKARPRVTRRGGKVITYTPGETVHAENLIREQVMKLEQFYDKVPLQLVATFYRNRPKHLPQRVQLPTTRPDWDNYAKLLTDALEKFVYANDSQITTAIIKKRFGSPPRIDLKITEEGENDTGTIV